MAHHGAVITGADRAEAFARAQMLEKVCRRACRGQPEDAVAFDEALAQSLTAAAEKIFAYTAYTAAAPALACAAGGYDVSAQLDDMAQMIGPRLEGVKPEEASVLSALGKRDAVLVPGVGAICRACSEDDCRALCLLAEKACVSLLHTKALGVDVRLFWLDTRLMRMVNLKKIFQKERRGEPWNRNSIKSFGAR